MELFPSIDIRGGRCVRLVQGDFERETVYSALPSVVARSFQDAGARWVHVVDLDAARTGALLNLGAVASVADVLHPSVRLQAGGGVRNTTTADALLKAGANRVVLGTAAIEHPELVRTLAARTCVAVALDVRGRDVAIKGWTEGSGADVLDMARRFEDAGAEALVVTQIQRDGTLEGPDLEGVSRVLEVTSVDVIASGGVGTLADIDALAALSVGGRRLAGVIVGRALHEGRFSVAEAAAACRAND